MNKAITDGLVLNPPPFSAGLSQWSSGDGTPGSDTYAGAGGGVFVAADADFAGCLEIVKSQGTQRVRFMGQTPVQPGLYLRVTARVKCIAGAMPAVRVSGFAGTPQGALGGVTLTGPSRPIAAYGQVVEVSAIIGWGLRGGVDMVWPGATYGHLGIEFTGANGGVLRIDDLVIEDVTTVFIRDMLAQVDVRDYGARGDNVANDAAAFGAADAAANGRTVLVPAGTYRLDGDVTFTNPVRFEGRVTQPASRRLLLQRNFDMDGYLAAFGDEQQAFRKGYQALLNFADHESFNLNGRRISLTGPLDMQACDPSRTSFAQRRVIRNGQFQPAAGSEAAFADTVVTRTGTYAVSNPLQITNVANAASIPVGSLVTGNGVGREVYVREVNAAQGRVTLSAELFDAAGTQSYTFRRFKYLLDFSGYAELSSMVISDVEFQCDGTASAIMLAPDGIVFHVRDCFFTKPKDRAITSVGQGCQGMLVDRCQFISNEQELAVESRRTICFNANANDVKIRDNRVVLFRHFCVLGGTGASITGNHWFHGDDTANGIRVGGVVMTVPNVKTFITGNYIDNNFIEWTNEHDATPDYASQYSFGGLTVTGNIFTANDVAPWFRWFVIKPYGSGHFVDGLAVVGNVFRTIDGAIDRIEGVDTTYASLDLGRMVNVTFEGNVFNGVTQEVRNPLSMRHAQATLDRVWILDPDGWLPFQGRARVVESVTPEGRLLDADGDTVYEAPWTEAEYGSGGRQFRAVWATPVTGTVRARVRMDNPQ